MTANVAQCECNNIKCYASVFSNKYRQIKQEFMCLNFDQKLFNYKRLFKFVLEKNFQLSSKLIYFLSLASIWSTIMQNLSYLPWNDNFLPPITKLLVGLVGFFFGGGKTLSLYPQSVCLLPLLSFTRFPAQTVSLKVTAHHG